MREAAGSQFRGEIIKWQARQLSPRQPGIHKGERAQETECQNKSILWEDKGTPEVQLQELAAHAPAVAWGAKGQHPAKESTRKNNGFAYIWVRKVFSLLPFSILLLKAEILILRSHDMECLPADPDWTHTSEGNMKDLHKLLGISQICMSA